MQLKYGSHPGEMTYGVFRPAALQRADSRIHLWPCGYWLYDGLRHYRHDQLRPWRYFHARWLRCSYRLSRSHIHLRRSSGSGIAAGDACGRDADDEFVELDDRARRLPPATRLIPPGAADYSDRHVDHAIEFHSGHAGAAQQ